MAMIGNDGVPYTDFLMFDKSLNEFVQINIGDNWIQF